MQTTGSSNVRTECFAAARMLEIEELLGDELADAALKETVEKWDKIWTDVDEKLGETQEERDREMRDSPLYRRIVAAREEFEQSEGKKQDKK